MIIYRTEERVAKTRDALRSLCLKFRDLERCASPRLDAIEQLLLEFGEFEAGLDDVLMGTLALSCEESRTARRGAVALGRMLCNTLHGHKCEYWTASLGRALADLNSLLLPSQLRVSKPEGYAYYALYPQSYIQAAENFHFERHPARAVVIGIRSIGTSLSAVVTGALAERGTRVESYTVRPGGHPWNRTLRVAETLWREWQQNREADFIIVDEGPGISGSSFSAVAEAISKSGVADERISFFPSWDAPAANLTNHEARRRWDKHGRYTSGYSPLKLEGMRDLSAGAWRELLYHGRESDFPAVQPQHEARKYLSDSGVLLKFAGLGVYGEWKLARQRALANAGFSPNALGFTHGYLAYEFVPGRPLTTRDLSRELLDRIAEYLAFRALTFTADRGVAFDKLEQMIEVNTAESLGREFTQNWRRWSGGAVANRPAIEVDGRMMPHEWIATSRGILKTDAVDHHSAHFLPGATDVAWDLAGAMVEFEMQSSDRRYLLQKYAGLSGDYVPSNVMRFYRTAYLAFRAGYSAMAAAATSGTPEHSRFGALQLAYNGLLLKEVSRFTVPRTEKISA